MIPLRVQWSFPILTLLLILFCSMLALDPCDTSFASYFLWPFVHVNILHWGFNSFAMMTMWRVISYPRIFFAWISSVLAGYIHCAIDTTPIAGISGIVFFLIGSVIIRCRHDYIFRLLAIMVVSFFIPGIAADVHAVSFLLGILYAFLCRFFTSKYTCL